MTRDLRSILGGLLVTGIGLNFFAASFRYDIGTLGHMGAGFFPLALSILAVIVGLVIAIPGFFRSGDLPALSWRPLVFIPLTVALFGLGLPVMGLIPTVFLCICLAAMSEPQPSWIPIVLLGIGTAVVTWVLFIVLLKVSMPAFAGLF